MTDDEPPKPKRKRWRWLAVGGLLILGWWYWPRGDERFVGTFKTREGDVLVLRANGSGRLRRDSGITTYFSWSADGMRLTMVRNGTFVERGVAAFFDGAFGVSYLEEQMTYEVVILTPRGFGLKVDMPGDPRDGERSGYGRVFD